MKKILISVSILAFVGVVVAQTTGAFFTDADTVTGNTFTAGTLNVTLTGNDSTNNTRFDLGNISGMAPGDTTGTAAIDIKNGGSIPLAWFGYFTATSHGADMTQVIYIKSAKMEFLDPSSNEWLPADQFITDGVGSGLYPTEYNLMASSSPYGVVTLAAWNADNAMGVGPGVQVGALNPNFKYRFSFQLGMVDQAGNTYQGKSMDLSYTVKATQVNSSAITALGNGDGRIADNLGNVGPGSYWVDWFNTQLSSQ
ncbi:MAG TPA: SipW-dependent-type signal peptide-containing protein [Candidatus Paceibacterota bacterium]|nr:SipW-dependent-type signal peptide-containing protein [Candidatus Paceibacterota bacterium]